MEVVTARELILSGARMAGRGGEGWPLVVQPARTSGGEVNTGAAAAYFSTTTTLTIANLMVTSGRPTLMERWKVYGLQIPAFLVGVSTGGGAELQATKTILQLSLFRNGDLVAHESSENKWEPGENPLFNTTFGADLVNEIPVERGHTLSLQLSASWQGFVKKEGKVELIVAVCESRSGFGGGVNTPSQGFLTYDSETLTGHRQL